MAKKILHIYKHTEKPTPPGGTPYNPWKSWRAAFHGDSKKVGLGAEREFHITSRIGSMPKASIEHVFSKCPEAAINYACADSDATRRGLDAITARMHNYEGRVMEADFDR